MKISKLFHWLYACLLLLPIACFLPNAFYYGFNAQAQASERIEQQPIYYQSNEVNSFDDLIIGNVYTWNDNYTLTSPNQTITLLTLGNVEQLINEYGFAYNEEGVCTIVVNWNGCYLVYAYTNYNQISNINSKFFQLVLANINNTTFDTNLYTHIIQTERQLVKEYQPIIYTNSITDSMSIAWQQTWSNPLFSWAEDSFLVAPFNYITNLFGVPNNSTFSIALSYWCAISIIWLVFDLFMYVPLLAHRMIDKAKIE